MEMRNHGAGILAFSISYKKYILGLSICCDFASFKGFEFNKIYNQ
jgi:hypothetical protein